jgi:hypothetical protein
MSAFDPLRTLGARAISSQMTRRENAIRVLICFLAASAVAAVIGIGSHRFFGFSVGLSWLVCAVALSVSYELAKLLLFRSR